MAEPVHLTSIMAEIGTSRQLPQLTFSINFSAKGSSGSGNESITKSLGIRFNECPEVNS